MKPTNLRLKRHHQETHSSCSPTNPSDFSFKIAKIAVSQICQSIGFKSTQSSTLEAFTHITTLYLKTLATTAVSCSNASNRTHPNIFDLINALHHLSSAQGFPGASTLHTTPNSLLTSYVLKDLSVFVYSTEQTPFAIPIHRTSTSPFPLQNANSIHSESGRRIYGHIPRWLPDFPDESTYKKCKERPPIREVDLLLWENSCLVQGEDENRKRQDRFEQVSNRGGGGLMIGAMDRRMVKFKIGKES